MELDGSSSAFEALTGIGNGDVYRIFNELRDYVCVHSVEFDQFGDVVDGRLRAWNRAYEKIRTHQVEMDQSIRATYFNPEIAIDFVSRAWREGSAQQVFELTPATRDRYRPDGAVVYFNVLWQRVGDYVVEVGNDLSEVRMLQMQLEDHQSAAATAMHARIVAEERERIARDLHDSVIQQLFASALFLNSIAVNSPSPYCADATQRVAETLSQVITEIRECILHVRKTIPSSLEMELRDAVGFLAGAAAARFVVDVADDVRCDGEIRSNLRSVVRESATNAVKHGHAENITISVIRSGYHVIARITDDGVGMPEELVLSSGLSNLHGRAEQLGGSMTVGPRDGGGTVVTWRVPLPTGAEN